MQSLHQHTSSFIGKKDGIPPCLGAVADHQAFLPCRKRDSYWLLNDCSLPMFQRSLERRPPSVDAVGETRINSSTNILEINSESSPLTSSITFEASMRSDAQDSDVPVIDIIMQAQTPNPEETPGLEVGQQRADKRMRTGRSRDPWF